MSHNEILAYRLLAERCDRPAWDVLAQRGESLMADARDEHARADLLCAFMLHLYPDGADA
jgi:hypothetical protein